MPKKAPPAKSLKRRRSATSTLLKTLIEDEVSKESERIARVNASFNNKRKGISKDPSLKAAYDYLRKERNSYDSLFSRVDKKAVMLGDSKAQLKKAIARKALRAFPGMNAITRLNAAHVNQLQNALHPGHGQSEGLLDRGLLAEPEVLMPELEDYTLFEPPFALRAATNVGVDFDEDSSFPWAEWGILYQNVRLRQGHSWTDSAGYSGRYAYNSVAVGINYHMAGYGVLEITVALTNHLNEINCSLSDNWGPSDASVDIKNLIMVPVFSAGMRPLTFAEPVLNEHVKSDGEEMSTSLRPIQTNSPILLTFRTGLIREGGDFQIMVASWLRIDCHLTHMDSDTSASLLWKVDRFYVRSYRPRRPLTPRLRPNTSQ